MIITLMESSGYRKRLMILLLSLACLRWLFDFIKLISKVLFYVILFQKSKFQKGVIRESNPGLNHPKIKSCH